MYDNHIIASAPIRAALAMIASEYKARRELARPIKRAHTMAAAVVHMTAQGEATPGEGMIKPRKFAAGDAAAALVMPVVWRKKKNRRPTVEELMARRDAAARRRMHRRH